MRFLALEIYTRGGVYASRRTFPDVDAVLNALGHLPEDCMIWRCDQTDGTVREWASFRESVTRAEDHTGTTLSTEVKIYHTITEAGSFGGCTFASVDDVATFIRQNSPGYWGFAEFTLVQCEGFKRTATYKFDKDANTFAFTPEEPVTVQPNTPVITTTKEKPNMSEITEETESALSGETYPAGTLGTEYDGFGWVPECEDDEFNDENAECSDCGSWVKKSDGYKTAGGRFICDDCYDKNYFTSDGNGEIYHNDNQCVVYKDYREYERGNSRSVSDEECSEDYFQCYGCDEWFSKEEETCEKIWVRHARREFSLGWLNSCDNDTYRECSGCGSWFSVDVLSTNGDGDYFCESCYEPEEEEDDGPIHGYHAYTVPPAVGEGPLWFGVEVEVLVQNGESLGSAAQRVIDELGDDHVVCSHDGSLNGGGFEIITAPHSLEEMRKLWMGRGWTRARKNLSGDNDKCGIHVHLSRDAFSVPQLDRFIAFVNADANRTFIERIARRSYSSYVTIAHKQLGKAHKTSDAHYDAVNTERAETVEVRIFKGNSRADRIMQCVEFCHALFKYTAPCSAGHSDEALSHKAFVKWVRTRRKEYRLLFDRLVELGYHVQLKAAPTSVTQSQPVTTEASEATPAPTVKLPKSLLPARPPELTADDIHALSANNPEFRRAVAVIARSGYVSPHNMDGSVWAPQTAVFSEGGRQAPYSTPGQAVSESTMLTRRDAVEELRAAFEAGTGGAFMYQNRSFTKASIVGLLQTVLFCYPDLEDLQQDTPWALAVLSAHGVGYVNGTFRRLEQCSGSYPSIPPSARVQGPRELNAQDVARLPDDVYRALAVIRTGEREPRYLDPQIGHLRQHVGGVPPGEGYWVYEQVKQEEMTLESALQLLQETKEKMQADATGSHYIKFGDYSISKVYLQYVGAMLRWIIIPEDERSGIVEWAHRTIEEAGYQVKNASLWITPWWHVEPSTPQVEGPAQISGTTQHEMPATLVACGIMSPAYLTRADFPQIVEPRPASASNDFGDFLEVTPTPTATTSTNNNDQI